MLFSTMNFSQFFSFRPSRRRAGYSIPAEVQTLQSKVLLSAVPAEVEDPTTESEDTTTESEDPTTEDPMTETATDPTTEEDPGTEDPSTEDPATEDPATEEDDPATETDDTTTDATELPVFISISIDSFDKPTKITGKILVPDGSSPTIKLGGALSELSVTIGADGTFTLTASPDCSGLGTISVVDDDGLVTDVRTVHV